MEQAHRKGRPEYVEPSERRLSKPAVTAADFAIGANTCRRVPSRAANNFVTGNQLGWPIEVGPSRLKT